MCSSRFSKVSTVRITSKPWREQLGQDTTRTPRVLRPRALRVLVPDLDLLLRLGGQADADRVTDTGPQQAANADGALDRPADQAARFGDAQMQRTVHRLCQPVIGSHGQKHIAGFHRDLEFVEIVILQQLDVIERAFDQGFGAGLAVFFQQVLFQAARVYSDADRAAIGLGRAYHLCHPLGRSDIARIDPQAGCALIRRFQRALVVKVDIRDDRHAGCAGDLFEPRGAFLRRAGYANDVRTRILAPADLVDGGLHILCRSVGHGLHADRRVAANGDIADHDLAAFAALYRTPGTDRRHGAHIERPALRSNDKPCPGYRAGVDGEPALARAHSSMASSTGRRLWPLAVSA